MKEFIIIIDWVSFNLFIVKVLMIISKKKRSVYSMIKKKIMNSFTVRLIFVVVFNWSSFKYKLQLI